jgi:predicted nuclease of restriction endonuclease-like (RecB) superfamily
MPTKLVDKKTYTQWLKTIKEQVRSSQLKATIAVNTELIQFYWELGKSIAEKQKIYNWGASIIDQLAIDLKKEFPDVEGFSRTNLYYIKQFYEFYSQGAIIQQTVGQLVKTPINKRNQKNLIVPQAVGQLQNTSIVPQAVGQIPWGHHRLIIDKIKDYKQALFYLHQTIQNNWSRNVLALQIDTGLHKRQGKAINNFKLTLPKKQSELAIQTLKDPYIFDFLAFSKNASERDIELQLTQQLAKFLLELGQGFAYVGSQFPIKVGKKDYKIDLLFYHTHLRCYVVIELKAGEFEPEHTGKLNFYLSAIDTQIKHKQDNPTIGILLCRTKDNIEVEYSLRDTVKPIGVSGYKFLEKLPKNLQNNLPSVAQLEAEFKKITRVVKPKTLSKKK